MRRALAGGVLALLLVAASGCVRPKLGGTLVLGTTQDVDAWNEYLSAQAFAVSLHRRIWLRLARETSGIERDPEAFAPSLASSWSFSPDRKTLTFTLRDAVWSDGSPVTADDVVFTWRAQTSPEVAWVGASEKEHIVSVEADGERRAVFRFDRAYPEQLADAVDGGILPRHAYGAIPFDRWRSHDWSKGAVGSGPFLLEAHEPGASITLVRNPRFWDPDRPRLDRVVVAIVPDAASLVTQFLSGTIDWIDTLPPADAERVEAKGGSVRAIAVPGYDYVGWNESRPPFDDREVRRALTSAIDRRALVDELLYGFGTVASGPVPSTWWCADREIVPLPLDVAAARATLERRGYVPGRPLELEMATNAGNRVREGALVKLQAQLGAVGVRVRTAPMEMKAFREKVASGGYDAYVGGWRFAGKIDLESLFGSRSFPPEGSNVVRYASPEVDRALAALAGGSDPASLRPVYAELQRRLVDDQPYTFLYEAKRLVATGPRVRGVVIDAAADHLSALERAEVAP